jgi:hypothetical protein
MAKIPTSNADIAALGLRVANTWANYPTITIEWITQVDAATLATNYKNIILQTSQTKGSGRDKVRQLQELDELINDNIYRLKMLIDLEYGKSQRSSHYADFGIVKQFQSFGIPKDRDSRLEALRLMVSSLATAPFQANAYGEAYWQDILTQYDALKTALETEVGKVSEDVVDKKILREQVIKLLKSMKLILRGNFPDTSSGVLREFGYLDERI